MIPRPMQDRFLLFVLSVGKCCNASGNTQRALTELFHFLFINLLVKSPFLSKPIYGFVMFSLGVIRSIQFRIFYLPLCYLKI